MLNKHQIREMALILMYEAETSGSTLEEVAETSEEAFELKREKNAEKLALAVIEHKEELDSIISGYSKTRSISRIAKINLIIMRIAIYEMKYVAEIDDKVAINEAIELAKAYSEKKDSSFINGVLNAYYEEFGEKS